jgi:hypothetical protein
MRLDPKRIIWVTWRLHSDGRVTVQATRGEGGGYTQDEYDFASLEEAGDTLGLGFREVVEKATQAGSSAGRWRP